MTRYWYDSWPGVKVETEHPILDFFGTPYGGPEHVSLMTEEPFNVLDAHLSVHAPYTTVSQNRGGVA